MRLGVGKKRTQGKQESEDEIAELRHIIKEKDYKIEASERRDTTNDVGSTYTPHNTIIQKQIKNDK